MTKHYDLFVIGAGSGGVRASRIAAANGAKVAVAEDTHLGGTCVNVGCVPKKLFVYASEFKENFETAKGFGWQQQAQPSFNWNTLLENKNTEIKRLNGIYQRLLDNATVDTFHGKAQLAGGNKITVNGETITADNIILATGGTPRKPDFEGAEYCITSDDAFFLETLPKRVLVQGGGYIAVEFAGIYNGLGCETELIYRGEQFLRGFDQDIANACETELTKKGIKLSFKTDIESVQKQADGSLLVQLNTGETREVDAILSAIGRTPRLDDVGLHNTQVTLNKQGFVEVNDQFETAHKGIYAIGDIVGRMALTPVALEEGMALANYLFNNEKIDIDYSKIATAVFCQPNIATVGFTEEQAKKECEHIDVYLSDFKALKHTVSGLDERTLMKLIVDSTTDKVIGCHMIGPDAAEIMQGIGIAMMAGATKSVFDKTIGIHPSAAEEFVTMRTPVRST